MMLSIQEVAKMTGLTSRALRLYEEVGILSADRRADSGARLYAPSTVDRLKQIVAMKAAGITLRDVSTLLEAGAGVQSLDEIFRFRMGKIDEQIDSLRERRQALQRFLTIQESLPGLGVEKAFRLSERERLELFALDQLERSTDDEERGADYAAYLKTELDCFNSQPDTFALIPAVKQVIEFASTHQITLGPGRGSAPASLLFHLMGFSKCDPVKWKLKPAVVFGASRAIWLDVSYSRGGPVVELCDHLSSSLRLWRIEAFRLPILDIIENVHAKIGHAIPYEQFADDSPEVLEPFRNGDCEKILWFDEPQTTMAARLFPEQLPEWIGFERMNEYLKSQKILNFRDILNIQALRRPKSADFVARMHEYVARKESCDGRYDDTVPFAENFGMILYHEDVIDLIERATHWDALRAHQFRYKAFKGTLTEADRLEFLACGDATLLQTIEHAAPYGFSKAHVVSHSELVKRCAILKSLHRDVYVDEAKRWEDEHGLSWSDFGFHDGRVCLLK